MGNRWRHFGIREDNQTLDARGWARYLKREGQLVFQNKTGNDETRHDMNQNIKRDSFLTDNHVRHDNKSSCPLVTDCC